MAYYDSVGTAVAKAFGLITVGVVIVFIVGLVFAFPVMLLWNWLMPEIFGLPEIGFWQAYGLNLLSGFLIKSSSVSSNKS